jgi:hypothetical protein
MYAVGSDGRLKTIQKVPRSSFFSRVCPVSPLLRQNESQDGMAMGAVLTELVLPNVRPPAKQR